MGQGQGHSKVKRFSELLQWAEASTSTLGPWESKYHLVFLPRDVRSVKRGIAIVSRLSARLSIRLYR